MRRGVEAARARVFGGGPDDVLAAARGRRAAARQVVGQVDGVRDKLAFVDRAAAGEHLVDAERGRVAEVRGRHRHADPGGVHRVKVHGSRRASGVGPASRQVGVGVVNNGQVLAVGQAGEGIDTAAVRSCRRPERVSRIEDAIAVGVVVERDGDAGDAGLAAVLQLVAEQRARAVVPEDRVTERVGTEDASGHRVGCEGSGGAKGQTAGVVHNGRAVAVGHRHLERDAARRAGSQRCVEPPLDVGDRAGCAFDAGPGGAVVVRVADRVRACAGGHGIGGICAVGDVRGARRNRVLHHERHAERGVAHGDGAGIGVGQRVSQCRGQ